MKFYPFNMGDYAEKTAHLTWDEDAAYRKMLDWYYSTECPLPADPRAVYRKMKADTEDRRAACDAVLNEFFTLTEEGWRHAKCDEKIAKFYAVSKSASERGKAGAEIKKAKAKLKDGGDKLQLEKNKLPNTQYPIPNTQPPTPSGEVVAAKDDFQKFDDLLRAIPGIEKHPVAVAPSVSPLWRLVQAGANVQTQIVPTIKTVLTKSKPGTINGWGYFVDAVMREISLSSATPPITAYVPPEDTGATWQDRLMFARNNYTWDPAKWGPYPNQPGCMVPPALVRPDDGKGWKDWKAAS